MEKTMTMREFRQRYGHQASGLRLLVDELLNRGRYNLERITDEFVDMVNEGMQDLQSALMDVNLAEWRD
jgi:hypothetical protein